MKAEPDEHLVTAFNADAEAKLQAIWAALSPEERACREERHKQMEAQAVRAMSVSQTIPYAVRAALSSGALPPQGLADPRVVGERPVHDYQSDLLRRLGVEASVPVTVQQMWKAARSVGFSREQFGSISPVDLWHVLEAKATVLERLRGRDYSEVQEVLEETIGVRGGRPPGASVDAKKLKDYRGETSQEGLAATCNVSVDSISRGEAGGRWSDEVFQRVARGLTTVLNRPITPEDLKNEPQ